MMEVVSMLNKDIAVMAYVLGMILMKMEFAMMMILTNKEIILFQVTRIWYSIIVIPPILQQVRSAFQNIKEKYLC